MIRRPTPRPPATTAFFAWLRRRSTKPPKAATVDQVIEAVIRRMNVDRRKLMSPSRERRLALTRALIGWHVTHNGLGTLTEVARRLGRDPSSVYTAYERYRAWRPRLFADTLEELLKALD